MDENTLSASLVVVSLVVEMANRSAGGNGRLLVPWLRVP